MEIIVSFDPGVGIVFSRISSDSIQKYHTIGIETLKIMSLSDLDYAISTNIISESIDIQNIFSEYLWSDDGKSPPRLQPNARRG